MLNRQSKEKEIEEAGKDCEMCGHCCSFDSGIFLDEDIKRIADHLRITPEKLKQKYLRQVEIYNKKVHKTRLDSKPFRPCVFLIKNKCSIHEVKPRHCRLAKGCGDGQKLNDWFMFNYIVDTDDEESMRQWRHYERSSEVKG